MDKEKHLTEAVPHRWGLLGWSYGNVRGKSGVESFCCPKDGSGRRNDSKEQQRLFVRNWSQGPHRAHLEENAINVTKVGIIIGWNYTPVTLKELTPKRNLVNIMCVVKILRKKNLNPLNIGKCTQERNPTTVVNAVNVRKPSLANHAAQCITEHSVGDGHLNMWCMWETLLPWVSPHCVSENIHRANTLSVKNAECPSARKTSENRIGLNSRDYLVSKTTFPMAPTLSLCFSASCCYEEHYVTKFSQWNGKKREDDYFQAWQQSHFPIQLSLTPHLWD